MTARASGSSKSGARCCPHLRGPSGYPWPNVRCPTVTPRPWMESPWYEQDLLWNPSRYDGNAPWRGVFRAVTRLVTLAEPTYVWRGQEDISWGLTPPLHR